MNKKLSLISIGFILLAAGIADLLSLIPFVGILTGTVFWILISVFLWKKGYGFVNGRRLATGGISMLAEWIPAIQAFPLTLVGAVVLIFLIKAEEKTGIRIPLKGKGGSSVGEATNTPKRTPLNQDGVRQPRQSISTGEMPTDNI
jgi:hypothetical protein